MQSPKSSRPYMTAEALGALNLSVLTLAALIVAAFVAGWVDAVVGGGGLIQLPALLIGLPSDTAPAVILGTNKISSFCGTATSSLTYALRIPLDWLTVLPLVIASAIGSAVGALLAKLLPKEAFTPIVLAALIGVGLYIWRRPQLGMVSIRKHAGHRHYGWTAVIGLGVGAYDGFLGPGTGSFFVILLVAVLGYGFLEASATAKIANLVTNLSAIVVFAVNGSVLWALGLTMGAANLIGGYLGARTAISRGNSFVRKVFLIVLSGLIICCDDQLLQPGQAPSGAPQERAILTSEPNALRACVRSAWLSAAASQRPQNGCSAVCMRMINLPAVAALRGTTDGTYAGSAAGTSAERFRSQAISRSRKTRLVSSSRSARGRVLLSTLNFPIAS